MVMHVNVLFFPAFGIAIHPPAPNTVSIRYKEVDGNLFMLTMLNL